MRARNTPLAALAALGLGLANLAAPTLGSAPLAVAGGPSVEFTASGDISSSTAAAVVLSQVAAIDPDLHLALGDLSYGATGAEDVWCDFVTARVGAGFPFQLIAGNHESNGLNGNINDFSACLPNQLPGLVGTYGRQWYVDVPTDAPVVRVVAISPAVPFPSGDWSYAAGSARYAWTAAAIDGARSAGIPWVVAAMHKPCLSVGLYGCDVGTDITNLMVEKRVDLVLYGHEHSYMRTHQLAHGAGCARLVPGIYNPSCVADSDSSITRAGGTVFATVGTGGTALRDVNSSDPEAPYFAAFSGLNANPTWGNLHVTADADTLTAQFVRATGGTFSDAFTIEAPDPGANVPPTASFTATTSDLQVDVDGNGSTDPEGPISSFAWTFGDGGTATGATASHTYSAGGTYSVNLTVTDTDGASNSTSQQVTVTPSPGAPFVRDAFGRTVANGWGTADLGGAWSVGGGSYYSVSGGVGRIVMHAPGAGRYTFLTGTPRSDVDAQVSAALDKPATGGGTDLTLSGRWTGTGNEYRSQVKVLSTGGVRVALRRAVNNSATTLAQVNAPGLTYTPGQQLRIRLQVVGTSPTTLRTKVWLVSTPEPSTWLLETTDSTGVLQAPGAVGIVTYVSSSANNTPVLATFDDLVVTAP